MLAMLEITHSGVPAGGTLAAVLLSIVDMKKPSAGLLMYRNTPALEVLLVHPGGPFWANKDEGVWTIPKGEIEEGEDTLAAAMREFHEETSFIAKAPFHALGTIRQGSGKLVSAWAFEGDCNPAELQSNSCQVEWPPRSKRLINIPEIDRGAWFSLADAERKIRPAQTPLLAALVNHLNSQPVEP